MNIYDEWYAAEADREDRYDELIRQDDMDELLGLGRDFEGDLVIVEED